MNAVPNFETAESNPDSLNQRRDAIYTPLEEAVEELHNRRRRFEGKTPGRVWLQDHPTGFAILPRDVATPNLEMRHFLKLVDGTNLRPMIAGFTRCKFVTHNPLKLALANMGFQDGFNRHGQPIVEFLNILNHNQQGRPMAELKTFWGQDFISFHHELLSLSLNGHEHPVVFESSPQYLRVRNSAAEYYRKFLFRLCIADGILVEDYLLAGQELAFTRDVVLPAFNAVTAEFGLNPLIVRLTPPEEENSSHWFWYPGEMKAFVQERLERAAKKD